MDHYILDDDHNVIPVADITTWAGWFDKSKRRVARTKIGDVIVSTVFLGLDHQWGDGPPLVFETMCFKGEDGNDIYCRRCSTWEQAEKMHQEAVDWVNGGTGEGS